jgi:hypothetical protein
VPSRSIFFQAAQGFIHWLAFFNLISVNQLTSFLRAAGGWPVLEIGRAVRFPHTACQSAILLLIQPKNAVQSRNNLFVVRKFALNFLVRCNSTRQWSVNPDIGTAP